MHIEYLYTLAETRAATGYFSCEPDARYSFLELCQALKESPFDTFLHLFLLQSLRKKSLKELKEFAAANCSGASCSVFSSLLLECAFFDRRFSEISQLLGDEAQSRAQDESPLLYLRLALERDLAERAWINAEIAENKEKHRPLPSPSDCLTMAPYLSKKALALGPVEGAPPSRQEQAKPVSDSSPFSSVAARTSQELALLASDRLLEAGLLEGAEMRHESSLAPFALLRNWRIDLSVHCGRLDYSLSGKATAYGRGLSLAQARVSLLMEIVERASAYVSIVESEGKCLVLGRKSPLALIKATREELLGAGHEALDLTELPLDCPPPSSPLYWLGARDSQGSEVFVPAQLVFLFANLDEQELCTAGSSTGLASGTTMAQAKLAALTELLERDAEASMPFQPERCFLLRSRDPRLQALFDDYAARGICVQFQDLTHEFGVPVYQCFVTDQDGSVVRAQACKLNGAAAALAALTETPWPYALTQAQARGKVSAPGLSDLPVRFLEDLPDVSCADPEAALALLEARFSEHHLRPLYVDLTRDDLDFPVVRAIVPKLRLSSDTEPFSLPDMRLLGRILKKNAE